MGKDTDDGVDEVKPPQTTTDAPASTPPTAVEPAASTPPATTAENQATATPTPA